MNPAQTASVGPANDTVVPANSGGNGSEVLDRQEETRGGFLVRLDEYEGPLDALLDLIKKQKLNILDIPVARITEQYLAALRAAKEVDVELSAEFVMMAATLIHIKSKTLLPITPTVQETPEEDPRDDLVQRLLEREKFLRAAQMLREKRVIEENVWTLGVKDSDPVEDTDDEPPELDVSLFDLVKTFGEVLERLKNDPVMELEQETVSVSSRIQFLKQLLLTNDGSVSIHDVLRAQRTPRALVATFLALLEMVKARAIQLTQEQVFGEILIRKHEEFNQAFQGGALFDTLDAEMEYLR